MLLKSIKIGSIFEFLKYGSWGVVSNIAAYISYLSLTYIGIDPKLAVAVIAPFFVLLGFFVVRKYIFKSNVVIYSSIVKYVFLCIIGNLINILILYIFVDLLFFPHQIIQLVAMLIVGLLFFISMKYLIFK
tara:strand:+ start:336 stop:728 length:393 start_codon:yes stop_codon:yes gene_type:complete